MPEMTQIDNEQEGKVVTFYSYKGGVGRSMALANVAVLLAKSGKKVLVVDWDLEAPGIDRYFREQTIRNPSSAGGLLSLLKTYQSAIESSLHEGDKRPSLLRYFKTHVQDPFEVQLPRNYLDLFATVTLETGHTLDILPSGETEESYSGDIAAFSWQTFFADSNGARFIESLRDFWRRSYDFVLIDSRTGVTDAGGICTVQLPDYLVLVFSANDQNLEGATRVVRAVHEARARFGYDRQRLMIIPLLSRFDGRAETQLSSHWLERCSRAMQPILDEWLPKHTSALEYFDRTKLPHIPKFAFGEQLAALHERETDPDTLTFYYSALTRLLAGSLVRPERLLALPRRMSDSEKAEIFRRAGEQQASRETIAQIARLIASLPTSARDQAQQLRSQIEKLAIGNDDSLRDDLEAIALDAADDVDRDLALQHLKDLPEWTESDSATLQSEALRRRPNIVSLAETEYVFISYTGEDAAAAEKLRAGLKGVPVWHDRKKLVSGEAWDRKISQRIAGCSLFLPIISANTERRSEGDFVKEWQQAVLRAQTSKEGPRFILPIVIDGSLRPPRNVPKEFLLGQYFVLPDVRVSKGLLNEVRRRLQLSQTTKQG